MQSGGCSSVVVCHTGVSSGCRGHSPPLTVHALHLVLAGWVSSERAPSDDEYQSCCSRAHEHQLQAPCWVLARSQGTSQCQDTLCSDRNICFLVSISFLTPSFSDILINLSPHQGFDLFICSYALRQLRHFSGLWLSTSFLDRHRSILPSLVSSGSGCPTSHIHV